jgi:chromosome segregation ATPase
MSEIEEMLDEYDKAADAVAAAWDGAIMWGPGENAKYEAFKPRYDTARAAILAHVAELRERAEKAVGYLVRIEERLNAAGFGVGPKESTARLSRLAECVDGLARQRDRAVELGESALAAEAKLERVERKLAMAEKVVARARELGSYQWELRLDDSGVSDDAKHDACRLRSVVGENTELRVRAERAERERDALRASLEDTTLELEISRRERDGALVSLWAERATLTVAQDSLKEARERVDCLVTSLAEGANVDAALRARIEVAERERDDLKFALDNTTQHALGLQDRLDKWAKSERYSVNPADLRDVAPYSPPAEAWIYAKGVEDAELARVPEGEE